jgi:hypothetical protein
MAAPASGDNHASPSWPAAPAAQAPAPSAAAPIADAATPLAAPPAPSVDAGLGAGSPGAAGATAAFNAGAGTLQPDGKTIVYHIPDGTGGNDWDSMSKPIRAKHGMVVRLIDDDKSTRSGGHWLHTFGQPCPHGSRAIGTGYDCVINQNAPMGIVPNVFEHNIANGIGRLYIEIVN